MTENKLPPLRRILGDVPLPIKVVVGIKKMKVREIAALKAGAVLRFTKVVGEPVDVLIADQLVFRGEIVIVNKRYAVRFSEIVSLAEDHQQNLT